jgi:hypothetical protein
MFAPVRVVATILFLGSIGLVFVGAFVLKNDVGVRRFDLPRELLTSWLE